MTTWKQARPSWCGHLDCQFARRAMDAACCGVLPSTTDHGESKGVNTHRVCINPEGTVEGNVSPGSHVVDLMINGSDCEWLRWILDAVDGKKTSWHSSLAEIDAAESTPPA